MNAKENFFSARQRKPPKFRAHGRPTTWKILWMGPTTWSTIRSQVWTWNRIRNVWNAWNGIHCHWLLQYVTGWWFQPLWQILVGWDDYSHYLEKYKSCSKPPTRLLLQLLLRLSCQPLHQPIKDDHPRSSGCHPAARNWNSGPSGAPDACEHGSSNGVPWQGCKCSTELQ